MLIIKNYVKEYFLRLRFYTSINRSIKNLKIIYNDNIKKNFKQKGNK